MTTSALTSLAILKVNWDHLGADYIENFVPFVVELARVSEDDVISLPSMQQSIQNEFGLLLPQHALRQIILRATKRGYFFRKSKVIYKDQEACDKIEFRNTKDVVVASHDRLLSALCEYAEKNHKTELSLDEAEEALTTFMTDKSLSLLYDTIEGSNRSMASEGRQFMVGSFVDHVRVADTALLDDLVLLARGNLLANAMYLPNPGKIKKKFRRFTVYFDTSFLMFSAGFGGPDRAAPCLELINLLIESRADLKCFSNTRNEVQGIIDACANRLQSGQLKDAYGPTIEYFIESGKTASDLELMSARLPSKLRELRIEVVDRPPFDDFRYQVDEKALEKHLDAVVGYTNPKARVHDVDCVSAIARMRVGKESYDVEECGAIFVTTNSHLAQGTREFFQSESAPGAVALAITSYALANLLWLKNPTVAPDLPRKWIIAHAYAAMQPPAGLWKKYLAQIARLEESEAITADEYFLLRHTLSAKAALIDLTDGSEEAFTEGSAKEILEVVMQNVRADLESEVALQRKRRVRAEEELQAVETRSSAQRQRLRSKATTVASCVRRVIYPVCSLLLIIGVVSTFPWNRPAILSSWQEYVVPMCLVLVGALTVANLMFGTTLQVLASGIERRISVFLEKALFSLASVESEVLRDNVEQDIDSKKKEIED